MFEWLDSYLFVQKSWESLVHNLMHDSHYDVRIERTENRSICEPGITIRGNLPL